MIVDVGALLLTTEGSVSFFPFLFLETALSSAFLIFFSSSESLANSSDRYSFTVSHPATDRSANLIHLFLFSILVMVSFISFPLLLTDPLLTKS